MSQGGILDVQGATPSIPTQFTTNSGSAVPASNILDIVGTGNVTTSGATNVVTITLTGLTQHATLVGNTSTITPVGPSATSGQIFQSQGLLADPAFSTATYPSTTTINQLLYSSSANVVTGLTTTNRGVVTTNSSGVPTVSTLATDGFFIIGSTAGSPAQGTITSSGGTLTVTRTSNSINLDLAGAGIAIDSIGTQTGTNPISPTAAGLVTINGAVAAAGTNPVRSNGTDANTMAIEVQKTQAIAAADATKIGLANFDSSVFTVDASGFVTLNSIAAPVGSSVCFFPNTLVTFADNLSLTTTPATYAEVINAKACTAATSPVFFERLVSGALGTTSIPAGAWEFNIYAGASSVVGSNVVNFRVNKRVAQTGMTATFTGAGPTRTFTVSGGTPFVPGDASASRLLANLVETPTQTGWISAYISSSVVTVTLTDPAFVNVAGVSFDAIYYYLFNDATPELTDTAVTLYQVASVQPEFTGFNITDRLVLAVFGSTDGNRTLNFYYGGNNHFSYFCTPLVTIAHLTGDSGGSLTADTNNNFNIFGLSGSKTSGSGSTLTIKSPPFSQVGSSATSALNTGEFVTAAVTRTLPVSAGLADGDLFMYVCTTAGLLIIQSVGAQKIRYGTDLSTAAGTITSSQIGDTLTLRFNATDGFFYVVSAIGAWTTA